MNNWTRGDRVLAFVRLVRRPVSLKEISEALEDELGSVSAAVSKLYQAGELNRDRLDNKYHYTDPAYDELLKLRMGGIVEAVVRPAFSFEEGDQ